MKDTCYKVYTDEENYCPVFSNKVLACKYAIARGKTMRDVTNKKFVGDLPYVKECNIEVDENLDVIAASSRLLEEYEIREWGGKTLKVSDGVLKKTCMNCEYYRSELSDPNDTDYHFHNWCGMHGVFLDGNKFWNLRIDEPCCDDFETGDACCYLFEPANNREVIPCNWFEQNREINLTIEANETEES